MYQNKYLFGVLILFIFNCCDNKVEKKCSKFLHCDSIKKMYFCVDTNLTEVPAVKWGLIDSREFRDNAVTITVSILDFKPDIQSRIQYYQDKCKGMNVNSVIAKQETLKNDNILGILTECQSDSLFVSNYVGITDDKTLKSGIQIIVTKNIKSSSNIASIKKILNSIYFNDR
jgi:hypothetical protein